MTIQYLGEAPRGVPRGPSRPGGQAGRPL